MNYFDFRPGDFYAMVQGLDLEGQGIVLALISRMMTTEKPIKTQWVYLGFQKANQEKAQAILENYFEETADGWIIPSFWEQILKYQANSKKNRENGKKGGRPKKATGLQNETQKNPVGSSGFSEETQKEPNQKATNNHKPITNIEKEIDKEKAEAESSPETVQRNVFGEPERDQNRGRKTRIPFKAGDSIPTKFLAYAEKEMPKADHQSEFDRFVDHHLAKGSTSSDWEASWRTWLRNAKKFAQERSEGTGSASAHRTDKDASKRRNGGLGDITTPVGYEVPEGLSTDAGPGGEPGPDCPW